jgi:hypothetical protein
MQVLMDRGKLLKLCAHFLLFPSALQFLTQVRRITMQQSNSTLLDFLVYFIATNHAHLNFTSFSQGSFKHLQAALKVDEWLLAMELRYLGEEHAKVRKMNEQDEYEKQNRSVTSPSADDHDDGAPRFPFPVSSFPPRVPRFLQYSTQRLTILRHRYQAAKTDIIDLCKFLCVQPEEVVDPSADSLPSSGGGPDSPTRTDAFGFSHLLPLGEVASSVTTAATLMSSSSRADFGENVPTHTRFNWLGALTTLHTFIGEFALAHSDFTVSQRGRKAAPAANRS